MKQHFMKLLTVCVVFQLIPVVYLKFWCVPYEEDYYVDCNRCWCVAFGKFVCSKMNCTAVPKQFKTQLKFNLNKRRSAVLTAIGVSAAASATHYLFPIVMETLKSASKALGKASTANTLRKAKKVISSVFKWVFK